MKSFPKNIEIFPSVVSLLLIYEKYKKYDNVTLVSTVLLCGYRDMGEKERRQFIEELQAEGDSADWIPFITHEERVAYYAKCAKEQGRKTNAEEADETRKRKEREKERERNWIDRSQHSPQPTHS